MLSRMVRAAAAGAAAQVVGGGGGTPGSTGLIIAATGAVVDGPGSRTWSNPGNITADDGVRASSNASGAATSERLYATFDLSSVPDGATITGVDVRIQRDFSSTGTAQVRDSVVQLTENGTDLVGDNKADTGTDWPQSTGGTNKDYSFSAAEAGSPSAADVKGAAFGVMLEVTFANVTASSNARVDAIWINIHYES